MRLNEARTSNGVVTTPIDTWNANLPLTVPLLAPHGMGQRHTRPGQPRGRRANAVDVRRQLGAAVGRAYLTVLLQHREVEVAARARETAAAHYDYAHTRLNAGLGNAVDDARAEQELRTTRPVAGQERADVAGARPERAGDPAVGGGSGRRRGRRQLDRGAHRRTRPSPTRAAPTRDVKVLAARRAAAAHLRRDEWAYYAPSLLAQAQAFRQTATLIQPSGWQAQLVLSIPLFDGGFRYGVRRERRASRRSRPGATGRALTPGERRGADRVRRRSQRRREPRVGARRRHGRRNRRKAGGQVLPRRAPAPTSRSIDAERRPATPIRRSPWPRTPPARRAWICCWPRAPSRRATSSSVTAPRFGATGNSGARARHRGTAAARRRRGSDRRRPRA